jgi:hypothetical protein
MVYYMSMNNTSGEGDIQIGAVEIKDATTDTRAVVNATYGLSTDVKRDVSTSVRAGSIQGKVSLSTIPAILKIGASSLAGRHTLTVYNDASEIVYIGFNDDVDSDDGFQISAGAGVTFNFDPAELVEVYGVLDEGTTSITLIELK